MDEVAPKAISTVGAYDAKTRLSELLDRVERGEQVVITRHGRPGARLVPNLEPDLAAARGAVARLVALGEDLAKQGVNFTDAEIRALRR